jgi:uncharacterized membrane protein
MELKDLYHKPLAYLQHLFATGFIFLLPITITFSLFSFFFNIIKKWLGPIKSLNVPIVNLIPHHEILLLILFIFVMGLVLKTFIIKPVIQIFEELLGKIPFVRTIYMGIKKLVHAFTAHDQASFKKVVVIEYPRQGIYSIGFLTKDVPREISSKNLCGVYIPHTPNPASGNFVMVPKESIFETDLTRHEATALIISGGIVQPNRYTQS